MTGIDRRQSCFGWSAPSTGTSRHLLVEGDRGELVRYRTARRQSYGRWPGASLEGRRQGTCRGTPSAAPEGQLLAIERQVRPVPPGSPATDGPNSRPNPLPPYCARPVSTTFASANKGPADVPCGPSAAFDRKRTSSIARTSKEVMPSRGWVEQSATPASSSSLAMTLGCALDMARDFDVRPHRLRQHRRQNVLYGATAAIILPQ